MYPAKSFFIYVKFNIIVFQFALALLMAIPYGKLSSIERRVMPLLLSRHKRRTLLLSRSIVVFLSCALLLIACEGSSLLCASISVGHTDFHSYASYIVPSNDYLIQITTPADVMHPFTYSGESLLKNVPFLMVIYFILLIGSSLIVYYKSYHSITP